VSDIVGKRVPWYRVNGWISQSGGDEWTRWTFNVLGLCLVVTPWTYTGDRKPRTAPQAKWPFPYGRST
jgi:hypothetical protein